MNFSGKNVLVTGASRGIGAEIAKVLAGYGLKVWINYRSGAEAADKVKEEIEANGGSAAVIGFDVSDEKAFVEAVKTIIDSDGELSYLVNNAGITNDKLAMRMSVEDFKKVIDANLTSTFVGCREALKVMSKKRFGSVVNVASVVAEAGNMGQANYVASKGGVIAMTKTFALEGAPRGIRFNSVTPGFIDTDMTKDLPEKVKEEMLNRIPLKRFAAPAEVAKAVAFLLSDDASYITGETLKVNGGMYM
ncbi:3-oxoacyl-(acyl-carrier-protein) reductase [Nautilia profundicola AmH]|uniref:3-oxoacyl-[acyl-carrier-protein] reductase n=1 Tax=Nautilia profundicola (strain ATCC BAA-1463 / DSM 18972 / AmH) TaxID=598659 RepID=B9L7V7_NAUPA|nr:3-oxoacyl-ACP reductase FabG [Nautilia profundicola]ACM92840.1 3-oxoacyl-(acyl-carrier-protein) reductase [Nautilia profundicola AmH]